MFLRGRRARYFGATFGSTGATGKTLDASGKPITGTAETVWNGSSGGADSTQNVVPSTYAVVDNFQWLKGKHTMTFGFSYEWEWRIHKFP